MSETKGGSLNPTTVAAIEERVARRSKATNVLLTLIIVGLLTAWFLSWLSGQAVPIGSDQTAAAPLPPQVILPDIPLEGAPESETKIAEEPTPEPVVAQAASADEIPDVCYQPLTEKEKFITFTETKASDLPCPTVRIRIPRPPPGTTKEQGAAFAKKKLAEICLPNDMPDPAKKGGYDLLNGNPRTIWCVQ